jgi:tol-pal system protein YbgF
MKRLFTIISTLSLLTTGCALHQDIAILEERLLAVEFSNKELQKKNLELQKQVQSDLDSIGETRKSSDRSLRTQVAGMNADMEGMQQDVRLIKGRIEELEYMINRKATDDGTSGKKDTERIDEVNLALAKIDQRLIHLEQYLNVEGKGGKPNVSAPVPAAGSSTKPEEATSAKELYELARQAYDNGEMDKARQTFQKLLKTDPKSAQADNAQFWIGESYYREKWYERAILEYQTVIEKYPKGNKVPAAMLKQGMALLQIDEKSSARLILQELVKNHPKASESKIAAKKLKEF